MERCIERSRNVLSANRPMAIPECCSLCQPPESSSPLDGVFSANHPNPHRRWMEFSPPTTRILIAVGWSSLRQPSESSSPLDGVLSANHPNNALTLLLYLTVRLALGM